MTIQAERDIEQRAMTGRLITGLGLIVLGVVFLLGSLDVIDQPGAVVASWWPLVFVALGGGLAIEQRRIGAGPLLLAGVGGVLLAVTTDVVALQARVVWPVVVIAVGAWLILQPALRRTRGEGSDAVRPALTAVFGDRKLRSQARGFEAATITTLFGDVDLDLRDVESAAEMTVDITAIFGDIDVLAPAGWRVEVTTGGVFSDIEHRPPRQAPPTDAPHLRVRGFSLFGDVTVDQ
jgi:predicted membrane protein